MLPLFHLKWMLRNPADLLLGIPFSLTLMGILLAHEFGHFVVAERNGVYATLPYFIPAPTLIGTFGAVIRIKSPIRSRQALFDIGIAGPIAGFLVAVPVLFWGLALSKPMPPDSGRFGAEPWLSAHLQPGASRSGAVHAARRSAGQPVSASGRNCGVGGNVCHRAEPPARRTTRRRPHHLRGRAASPQVGDAACILALIPLGIFFWPGWLVWAVILGFTGMRHPNVPQWPALDRNRRWLVLLAVLMLVLTLALAPIRGGTLFGS